MTNNRIIITRDKIKKLREKTGAGVMDCRRALQEANGVFSKAKEILGGRYREIALKKAKRETGEGLVSAYIHGNGKIGAIVTLLCETDFVARTKDFSFLAKELAMQVAAMAPANIKELLKQAYIRDPRITVQDLIKKVVGKTGENISVGEIRRMEI
jgi:elongation factor Ts